MSWGTCSVVVGTEQRAGAGGSPAHTQGDLRVGEARPPRALSGGGKEGDVRLAV